MSEQTYDDEVSCTRCHRRIVQGKTARYEHEDCDPVADEAAVREANHRAGEKAREEQRKRGRLAFLEGWHR